MCPHVRTICLCGLQIIRGAGGVAAASTDPPLQREVIARYDTYDTWRFGSKVMRAPGVHLGPEDGILLRCTFNSTVSSTPTLPSLLPACKLACALLAYTSVW